MRASLDRFARGTSLAVLALVGLAGTAAMAQTPAAPVPPGTTGGPLPEAVQPPIAPASDAAPATGTSGDESEIVVTGTSIRGVAPIGSNLISVGTEALTATGAQTVTNALTSVPALSGMGNAGQGGSGSAFYQVSIHSLGASASNSTLNLIDGHRGPTGGTNHTFLDPNIIPYVMIERVEVLAEGASSVYGSDAVAGVVNFITRKRYDGLQLDGQAVVRDGTFGYSAGLLAGQTWDRGSAVFGATYIYQDNLANRDRPFTFPDQRGKGGTNFQSFFCSPASIQPAGSALVYPSPTAAAGVANTSANFNCTNWAATDRIGKEVRQNIMGKINYDLTDSLTVGLDLVYSRRRNTTRNGPGTIQGTVFQTGAQANPFYVNPPGVTATSQTIRWDATDLFGPALARSNSDSMYASFTAGYEIGGGWNFDFLASAGRDESSTFTENNINSSAAFLALNGTTNGGGSLTAISVPGTNLAVTQLPLTTANALDVWNPAATNRTSAAVRARILDNTNLLRNTSGYQQLRASVNGGLFSLPAGEVKAAFGAELLKTQLGQFVTRANNSGPASTGSQQLKFDFDRTVYSFYGELNVPLISEDMGVPLVESFDLSLAARYDHYDSFGSTTNPKIGFNWDVVQGLRLRGNYSTSFVAPPLTIFGDRFGAFGTSGWGAQTNNVSVPVAAYPDVVRVIPSCAGQTLCNIGTVQGIQVTSGDPNAGPQEGSGYSLGIDLAPAAVPNFRLAVTYFHTEFDGGVTGPQIVNVINTASAQSLLTFYPACATASQIAAVTTGIPQTSSAPACTSYIFRTLNTNFLNLNLNGIDYQFDYKLETSGAGTYRVGVSGTEFLKYRQSFGSGPSYSILNTTGNNGTFPSVGTQARGNLGWSMGGFDLDAFVNYTGKYRNWSANTVTPLTRDANGNPSGGGDRVKANTTFDLNLAYEFTGDFLPGTQLTISARNVFDRKPPFYNSSQGYDIFVANPFRRTVTIGLRMKLL